MHLIIEIQYIFVLTNSNYFCRSVGKKQLFWFFSFGV